MIEKRKGEALPLLQLYLILSQSERLFLLCGKNIPGFHAWLPLLPQGGNAPEQTGRLVAIQPPTEFCMKKPGEGVRYRTSLETAYGRGARISSYERHGRTDKSGFHAWLPLLPQGVLASEQTECLATIQPPAEFCMKKPG